MIGKLVRIQLVLFVALTLIGVSYVGARYAGLDDLILGRGYHVTADFADSGGIFETAEVTYRGVGVGRVDKLMPTPSGVEVRLALEDDAPRIPADTVAVVANRSAIGEQYIDLQPRRDGAPYLDDGATIARRDTKTPIATTKLLLDLDRLVNSVGKEDLTTVIDELGDAFWGTGEDLSRIVDSGNALIESADDNLEQTIALIEDGSTVLKTQRESGGAIKSFSRDLANLSDTLVASDPKLRQVLDSGILTAHEVSALLDENASDVPVLLKNLTTAGQIVRVRTKNLQQILIIYPYVVRGGYTVIDKDPLTGHYTAHFGLQLSLGPASCRKGYEGTSKRTPEETQDKSANTSAACKDEKTTMRGAQNAPRVDADSPMRSIPGSLGSLGGQQKAFGEDSWKWLLVGPTAR